MSRACRAALPRATRPARFAAAALLLCGALAVPPAAAADGIVLEEAWVRPAAEKQATLPLYVDIKAPGPLTLTGAKSPVAGSAALRVTDIDAGQNASTRLVETLPVAGGQATRLAPRGPYIELRDIARQLTPGDRFPVTLLFRAADGSVVTAQTEARVRGLTLRPPAQVPESPAAGDAASKQAPGPRPDAAPAKSMP
jgi:copper(I)-binding protein